MKKYWALSVSVMLSSLFAVILIGCANDVVEPDMTDDEFIRYVVSSGYDNDYNNEDNLVSQDIEDLNDEGALFNENIMPASSYDSLYKWGRIITSVNRNTEITNEGDSLKNVLVTTTCSGNIVIVGYVSNALDTTIKPFSKSVVRKAVFKRIANTDKPKKNWRLYKVSCLDGQTTQPEIGSSKVRIDKIEVYRNGNPNPDYTLTGPDFNSIIFVTKFFGGTGFLQLDRNEVVRVKVYTTSQMSDVDYVAFHSSKKGYGHKRVLFDFESQTGSGPYNRVFAKDITINGAHKLGAYNAHFSAATHESLYDTDVNKFAADVVGVPFKVTR